jgi:hypothetical protein
MFCVCVNFSKKTLKFKNTKNRKTFLSIAAWTSAIKDNIDEELNGAPSQAAAQQAQVFVFLLYSFNFLLSRGLG